MCRFETSDTVLLYCSPTAILLHFSMIALCACYALSSEGRLDGESVGCGMLLEEAWRVRSGVHIRGHVHE